MDRKVQLDATELQPLLAADDDDRVAPGDRMESGSQLADEIENAQVDPVVVYPAHQVMVDPAPRDQKAAVAREAAELAAENSLLALMHAQDAVAATQMADGVAEAGNLINPCVPAAAGFVTALVSFFAGNPAPVIAAVGFGGVAVGCIPVCGAVQCGEGSLPARAEALRARSIEHLWYAQGNIDAASELVRTMEDGDRHTIERLFDSQGRIAQALESLNLDRVPPHPGLV